ncbi:hypothetical protein C1926_10070 [Stenotrophomonas sp. ZAC14A_NAIMI4_1]|nr:hypothetical protein C1926_10070 [Stenotrophomonas sp. ZAC14A_NAIMI4_1]
MKADAVKQATKRGFSVAKVASRLGITSQSLYQWLRDDKSEAVAGRREGGDVAIVQGFSLGPFPEGRGRST